MQEIRHFSVFNGLFSSYYRMPSWEGGLRPPTSDRTPKSAQNWSHLGCQSDHFGGKFETEDHARRSVDKHRLMRTHDVHVHCDYIAAYIADITNGCWGNHTMEQPHNSRVRRCPRSVLNSNSSRNQISLHTSLIADPLSLTPYRPSLIADPLSLISYR